MPRELGHELLPLEHVRSEILALIEPLHAEVCPIESAHRRVLREDLAAAEFAPPFPSSAMDGYAVRASDLSRSAPGNPASLRISAELPAGPGASPPLERGTAARIMTGAPVPPGADAVVPHELTRAEGDRVLFEAPVPEGQHIRARGSDWKPGDVLLRSGVRLRGPQLAIAASLGRTALSVSRRPRIAIISTGDELAGPGSQPLPGQIRSSNQYALLGFLEEAGAEPLDLGIVPDRREAIREALRRAAAGGADGVVSTGGVSAGDRDYIQAILREEGRPGRVYKVAMRPGKPQAFGRIDGIPLFGLPGNPASAIVSFAVFVRPAVRRMLGQEPVLAERFPVRFNALYRYRPGRSFILRARVEPDAGGLGYQVAESGEQDSSHLSSLARANALVFLPGDRGEARAGEVFPAEWL